MARAVIFGEWRRRSRTPRRARSEQPAGRPTRRAPSTTSKGGAPASSTSTSAGHVVVRPDTDRPERALDLFELARDLEEQGVALPVLLRFSDILQLAHRVAQRALRARDQGVRVHRRLHDGLSDQGQPAAPRRRGDRRVRRASTASAWSADQAGAAGRARAHRVAPTTSSSATATRTRSSCASPSWARSSATRSSSCSSS